MDDILATLGPASVEEAFDFLDLYDGPESERVERLAREWTSWGDEEDPAAEAVRLADARAVVRAWSEDRAQVANATGHLINSMFRVA